MYKFAPTLLSFGLPNSGNERHAQARCGHLRHAGLYGPSTTAGCPLTFLLTVLSCVLRWRANHQSVRVVRPYCLLLQIRKDQLLQSIYVQADK
jgi:hypothetical protein